MSPIRFVGWPLVWAVLNSKKIRHSTSACPHMMPYGNRRNPKVHSCNLHIFSPYGPAGPHRLFVYRHWTLSISTISYAVELLQLCHLPSIWTGGDKSDEIKRLKARHVLTTGKMLPLRHIGLHKVILSICRMQHLLTARGTCSCHVSAHSANKSEAHWSWSTAHIDNLSIYIHVISKQIQNYTRFLQMTY